MRFRRSQSYFFLFLLLLSLVAGVISASAQGNRPALADLLADRPDLRQPDQRNELVAQMRTIENARRNEAIARARQLGLPLRIEGPGNEISELMDFIDGRPLYAVTTNREAAISTNAEATRVDLGVDGAGFTVGVWDAGPVRASHQEFTGRVNLLDSGTPVTHATHVAGTIAAAGIVDRARGMSPAVTIDSYNWTNDKSQMTSRGASYPGEPGTIYISNHSYGYQTGWGRDPSTSLWRWFGQGTNQNAYDAHFGRYNEHSRATDALAHNLPYYLIFWAAGNDRTDNPASGATVEIGGNTYTYNPAIHPPGDNVYKGGYDTLGFESVAKNVLTVGSVNDAVTFGERDLSKALVSNFSSWGPTDDGRIKPDIVANGWDVYSTSATSNTAYTTSRGTSMASPNAAGSAVLLVSYFDQLFPGEAMRAATLKGLIIHTADDLGTPGPNYQTGWGLMNTRAAADHLEAHHASPASHRLVEERLTTQDPAHTFAFTWDGESPIRATLSWTDPAGTSTTVHDDRTPKLVNNLDLLIHDPDGNLHFPYVMPYVGDWRPEMLDAPATTGKNNTDNVEQVFIASPSVPGVYVASVTFDGNLSGNLQDYTLLISGGTPPPLQITSISPALADGGPVTVTLGGYGFQPESTVAFSFPGEPDRMATNTQTGPGRLTAEFDTTGMRPGFWDVVITNPNGESAILPAGFAIAAPYWVDDFENGAIGWTTSSTVATSNWALTQSQSRSPTHSMFAPGPSDRRIDTLESPAIQLPADPDDLTFSFWHAHSFASNHGGILEFSIDGGPWIDANTGGSGPSFLSGGYNGNVSSSGNPSGRSAFDTTRYAWTGNKPGFSEVVVRLPASAFSGKSMRARWRLGTNQQSTSAGWHIDDVKITGPGGAVFPVPHFTAGPAASESPVTGTSAQLTASAANSDGSDGIVYTWAAVEPDGSSAIVFSENQTATAHTTTATFGKAGEYNFTVTARNAFNRSTSASVGILVAATPTSITVDPASVSLGTGQQASFLAHVFDQFTDPIHNPSPLVWSVDPAIGEVTQEGFFTAGTTAGGPFYLIADLGNGLSGTAEIFLHLPNFTSWSDGFFTEAESADESISGDSADPDHDGIPNLLAYALGGHPRQPNRGILPRTAIESGENGPQLVFTFSRPAGLPDVAYAIESSTDLIDWTPIPADEWEITDQSDTETITIRTPVSQPRFLRLHVHRQ